MKLTVSKHGHLISEYEFPEDLGIKEIIMAEKKEAVVVKKKNDSAAKKADDATYGTGRRKNSVARQEALE